MRARPRTAKAMGDTTWISAIRDGACKWAMREVPEPPQAHIRTILAMSRRRRVYILTAGPVAVVLALIWLITGQFWATCPVRLGSHLYAIDFSIGCIWINDYAIWNPSDPTPLNEPLAAPGWSFIADVGESGWRALPSFKYTGPVTTSPGPGSRLNIRWTFIMPLYPFFLALGIPAAVMLRTELKRRREARLGKCRECSYDLAGISGPCPECGAKKAE